MSASVPELIYKLRSEVILNYGKELWFIQIMFNIPRQVGIITANEAEDTRPLLRPQGQFKLPNLGRAGQFIHKMSGAVGAKSATSVAQINGIVVSKSAFMDKPTWRTF